MIDFSNSDVFKLKPIRNEKAHEHIANFLIDGEEIFATFKTIRDQVVFTNKRIITANVQGITGSKVDFTSIPYKIINTFSIETSGTLDLDCEIELYVSEAGKVRFEIKGDFDIVAFNKIISEQIMS